jgi:small glutamine-rich tetratricopeptide repeat-containing protein alpha
VRLLCTSMVFSLFFLFIPTVQCIGEAFGVDPSNKEQSQTLSVKPATLQSIFDVFIKTRDKISSEPQAGSSQSSPSDKVQAEKFKQSGNAQMSSKDYDAAIESYNQAVNLDPTNPVYYSNRAAAYSSKGDHLAAVGDAEKAISVDPKFVKAYHRLGYVPAATKELNSFSLRFSRHAQYSLGDFKASASAFERGLKLEPANPGLKSGLQNSQARIVSNDTPSSTESSSRSPGAAVSPGPNPSDLGGMDDMLRNMGLGSGGEMPDLASMMNNPQLMAMAQQMAANGGLANLMQSPGVAEMVILFYESFRNHLLILASDSTDEPCAIGQYTYNGRAYEESNHARPVR